MKIVLIGSGNVATQLGKALFEAGHNIVQVYSRRLEHAIKLSCILDSVGTSHLDKVERNADLYLLSVNDDALQAVVDGLPEVTGVVCHTAGSITIDILQKFTRHGVFYPFQTLSKAKDVDFSRVPMLLEGSDEATLKQLKAVAGSIADQVSLVSSEQRQQIHVAAVFACNFVNHMYRLASDILDQSGLSLDIIKPLIRETAEKVMVLHPSQTQTGPASRNDKEVIAKHIGSLSGKEPYASIYKQLSESIIAYHPKD